MNGYCPCGELLAGDGFTTVLHCPDAEVDCVEPDASPVFCPEGRTTESV